MPQRPGRLTLCSMLSLIVSITGPALAGPPLDADALERRLGITVRAGPNAAIEDEWSRPALTCTPIAARGAFYSAPEKVVRRPRVELEINFAFGSAELLADSVEQLASLAEALERQRLQDKRFLLVGHTDAVGADAANQALSEARARAVEDHLVEVHGIARERLQARGCGERLLADPADPQSPRNRRVEVIVAGP